MDEPVPTCAAANGTACNQSLSDGLAVISDGPSDPGER